MSETLDLGQEAADSQDNNPQKRKRLSILLELSPFVTPYKKTLIAALFALLLTASASLAIGHAVRLLIDQGFVGGSLEELNQAIFFLVGIITVIAFGTFIRFYLVSWLGERVCADIRTKVFDHLLTLEPSFFETNRSGEIMSRLTTDTSLLENIIGSSLSMALRNSLTFVGGLLMLLLTNFKLSLIVLSAVPLLLGPLLIFGRRVRRLSRSSQDRIADMGSYAGEAIEHIKTVQSFGQENYERKAFSGEVEAAFNVARKRIKYRAMLIAAVILFVFGAISGMLWVGGYDVLQGKMSGGDLGAFVFYAVMVASAVATLSEVFGELQRAAGAAERLVELLNVSSKLHIIENSDQKEKPNLLPEHARQLQFKNLNFSYPSRPDQKALNDFSLNIEAGQAVALVGPSGAGKSTVFELVQRFYDPDAGSIELSDVDLRTLSPEELRNHMALVPQQPALFTATVAHNIAYGKMDASEDEIIAAAKAAHAHDFIMQLPQAYQTPLGEKGAQLSGGQRQRVAIARAILKDPDILLLDEATSALDAESEFHVQAALNELMKNRTTLIIAHRLATITHADNIVVMDEGGIVAQGRHNELIESSPLYKRLAELQFNQ
ncbi:ABC transporter transmembrane domain-containing protein [Pseudoteredinibacter isoporae]|uniref:ATP-binding cassette subfamily B protein n=1 Tax=Pseudoteredinibacter isoporae TaxID=570281 RepID=A0A7X0JVW4_9GAMM|nr:ABC transporter transmembrane domain-containing protein [Pseudoteredinibacter isoporae]MBB6523162.1 ATP-binding cassette subfamily B protein [Pseudoteredinibacter isoporae]NHO88681.1 ATP-binding cassette domain-containing protein [Pseudoteredinibacter isoporae]NIB22628.1 ATP-binding cassette domain-containing protein [Pseudoteredinibacter isoporae]